MSSEWIDLENNLTPCDCECFASPESWSFEAVSDVFPSCGSSFVILSIDGVEVGRGPQDPDGNHYITWNAEALKKLGLTPKQIAEMLGYPPPLEEGVIPGKRGFNLPSTTHGPC